MNTSFPADKPNHERLLSLDFFRGLTMFLLVAEFSGIFHDMVSDGSPSWLQAIGHQFHHHPWDGLRFWDLIQPYFMFIVGVAMPLSFAKRKSRGDSDRDIRDHVLTRAFLLLLLGWWLYCIDAGQIIFKFQNVLAQLSVTYLIAYFLMTKSARTQITWSLGLLIATTLIYYFFPMAGFDQPNVPNENFGTWFDLQYGGADLGGHWVSFNAIPTAAHTIWGVLAGQLLMSERSKREKLQQLLIWGAAALLLGYLLSIEVPIIKRICTASFVLVSGGWTVLSLALCFWLIDMRGWQHGVWIFALVGMNPLFIYLFAHVGGAHLIKGVVSPLTTSIFGWMGHESATLLASILTLYLLWYLCRWLHQKKVYIRI